MSKSNASRTARPAKGVGFGSQKFIDPLAFAVGKVATPSATWQLDPANEAQDHINIHSESRHALGRWFNPRSTQSFPMGSLGSFNSIEAYMYFLLANSMRITEPDVIARVDALRLASSVMLGAMTTHLPNDLRQAYAHTYRLPAEIYKNIIRYVSDAYMSKLYVAAQASGLNDILDTEVAQAILSNRLPYFGYYMSNGVTMNVSQRTTIISAIKMLEKRLRDEQADRKRSNESPMKVALLKAGAGQLLSDNGEAHRRKVANNSLIGAIPDVTTSRSYDRATATSAGGVVVPYGTKRGLSINDVPATNESLEQFRAEAENDLRVGNGGYKQPAPQRDELAAHERRFHKEQREVTRPTMAMIPDLDPNVPAYQGTAHIMLDENGAPAPPGETQAECIDRLHRGQLASDAEDDETQFRQEETDSQAVNKGSDAVSPME